MMCGVALVFEAAVGFPNRLFRVIGHPVVWMGALLSRLDRRFNFETDASARRRLAGAVTLAALITIAGGVAFGAATSIQGVATPVVASVLVALLASSCLAQRSLDAHVRVVAVALERQGLVAARQAVAAIVGRETAALDEAAVARAAIESLAENFADGVAAPAFWLAVLGLPGGVVYKAINTADSMIGHRTARHEAFGFCAAKLDDVASWPGARLAALWLVSAAAVVPGTSARAAWRFMWRDARRHPSPNAGWPEAAMAGALGIRLGGPRVYGGKIVPAATIGDGPSDADAATIRRALRLYRVACLLQIVSVVAAASLIARW